MMQPHTDEPAADAPARGVPGIGRVMLHAVANSAVRILALFSLVNLLLSVLAFGEVRHWVWVDLRAWPPAIAVVWIVAVSTGVLAWPQLRGRAAFAARALVASAALVCAVDAVRFYVGWFRGDFTTSFPVPLSIVVASVLALWAWRPPHRTAGFSMVRLARRAALDVGLAALALLALCVAYGASDYRRPADAIVVYGAGVYSDGSPSLSLADRTRTACRLYHDGFAHHVVLSGGPREPAAMMQVTREMNVPDTAIVRDEAGVNTLATVRNSAALASQHGWSSLLMVSHDYHLARIKMFCQRAKLDAYTVPATETRPVAGTGYFYLRELAALVVYYFLPQLSE